MDEFLTSSRRARRGFRVGLLLVDGFALMSYASVVEPLRAANLLTNGEAYDVWQIPASGDAAVASNGVTVDATARVGSAAKFDLVLVVAGGDPLSFQSQPVFRWLRNLARNGVQLGGVSGGPAILAVAGLMEHRRMTVHWEHASALLEIAPRLMIERSLYVMDRDRITCAGGTAPLDLMHALITEHHGSDFARRVSDWFMHTDVRPSSGPQRAGLVERYGITSHGAVAAIEAMENHIADPLDLSQLAALASLSPRQLNRLFQEKIDQSTMTFYRTLRLEKARQLLQQSTLTITEIALATGFSSSAHFSKAFRGHYGETPSSQRL